MHAIEENQEWYSKNSSIHLFKYICILRANSLDVMDFYMIKSNRYTNRKDERQESKELVLANVPISRILFFTLTTAVTSITERTWR